MVFAVGDSGHVAEHNALETALAAAVALGSGTPAAVAAAGAVGTAGTAAHSDHVHAGVLLATSGTPSSDGTPSRGASSAAAAFDHVHPLVDQYLTQHGLLAAVCDPATNQSGAAVSAGTLNVARLDLPQGGTIAAVGYGVATAQVGGTSGQNVLGVYNAAGTLIGTTADQTTNMASAVARVAAVTVVAGQSLTVAPGDHVFVVLLVNFTTSSAAFWRPGSYNDSCNFNLTTPGATLRYGTLLTGQTSLPGTITPANIASASNRWLAVL